MIMQYDDMVLQTVARLKRVIPPTGPAVTYAMLTTQADLTKFYESAEKPKLMVTWSGLTAEGGREAKDFVKSMIDADQYEGHTIEIHICARKFMYENAPTAQDSLLKIAWIVRRALTGLKFYQRDGGGDLIITDDLGVDQAQTEGMFHMETLIDRQYNGVIVSVVRMQALEMITQADDVAPEKIWGTYQDITIQEHSGASSTEINTVIPNEEVHVT